MFKFFKRSLLSISLLSNIFISADNLINKNNQHEEDIKNIEVINDSIEQNITQVTEEQSKVIPLTQEEVQELLKSFSEEENALFKQFLEELTRSLSSLGSLDIIKEMEKICKARNVSLNVVLSVVPCKLPSEVSHLDDLTSLVA